MKNDMFSTVSLSAARMVRRALPMVAAAVVTCATLTPAFATPTYSWDDDDQRVMWKYSYETAWKTVEVRECEPFGESSFPAALTMPSCLPIGNNEWCGVGGIGDYAFKDRTELQSITIPWVNYIDSGAFSGCTSLSSVTFLGPVPAELDFNGVFENTPFLARITQENANDFAESAREIEGASGKITDTNFLATPNDIVEDEDAVEPLKGLASWLVGTKWYRWTAPATTTAWFDTYGSDFNTVLGVYEMNTNNEQAFTVEAVKGENNDYGGLSSLVSFSAVQGRTYWICVGGETEEADGMSRPRGNITLNWRTGTAVKLTLVTGIAGRNKKLITMTAYVPKGKAAGVLPTPDRTGYAFLGWYSKAVGGTRATPTSKFNKATKLYAHWSLRSFRLSVKPDEETEEGCKSVTGGGLYAHGKKVTITASAKDGYKFGMWNAPEYEPTENEFKNYFQLCRKNAAAAVTVYGRNMWYEAYFVSEADDYMELDVEDDYGVPDLITTWYADETKSISIYLQAKSKTYPTVTTTKLPSGVTFKLSEDYSADTFDIERRDARYLLSVPDTSKLGPGKHTITVTAKNRWGQIATKELVIFGKNKTDANAWLPGIVTAVTPAAAPYRMTVGILPEWNDFEIFPDAGVVIAKMAGLPLGVAWDAKKQRFTGYPTKAGMYAVTITASKKVGKKTVSKASTILVEVEKVPDGLLGTFNGYTRVYRFESFLYPDDYEPSADEAYLLCEKSKAVTLTIATTGKISAKVGTTTFTGGGLMIENGQNGKLYRTELTSKTVTKINKKKARTTREVLTFSIKPDADRFGSAFFLDDSWYIYEESVPGSITMGPDTRVSARLNKFGKDLSGNVIDAEWNAIAGLAAQLGEVKLFAWRSMLDGNRYKFTASQDVNPSSDTEEYEAVTEMVDEGNGPFPMQVMLTMTVNAENGVATLAGTLDGKSVNGTAALSPEVNDSAVALSMAAYARFFVGKLVIEVKLPLKTAHGAASLVDSIDASGIAGDGWLNTWKSYIDQ